MWRYRIAVLTLGIVSALSMGPGRCVESAQGFFSDLPAPDVRGTWNVAYGNDIEVEIIVEGQVYVGTISGGSGLLSFTHQGEPFDLDLDCAEPFVVCPSEIFPAQVDLEQRNFVNRPHQVYMTINDAECSGVWRLPDQAAGECGGDTGVDCTEEICDGVTVETSTQRLGSISLPEPPNPAPGSTPAYTIGLALSGGVVFPTLNCAIVGASFADADIAYEGTYDPEANTMIATELTDGVITVIFRGGCFWAGGAAGTLGAALLQAEVRLTTSFTATRNPF